MIWALDELLELADELERLVRKTVANPTDDITGRRATGRAPEGVRPHRRRALAGARPSLRSPRARPGERIATAKGRRRDSLFTGDVGTAPFAAACLDLDHRLPIVDVM